MDLTSETARTYRPRSRLASDFTVMKQSRRPARHLSIGMRIFTVFLVCAALLAQTTPKGPAKPGTEKPAPQKQDEGLTSITVDVNVVNVLASVRDKRGALIPSLTKD